MPSVVIPCFTVNRQSIEGVTAILRSAKAYRSSTVDGSRIEFFAMATRIENAEKNRLEAARGYARAVLKEYLPEKRRAAPFERGI